MTTISRSDKSRGLRFCRHERQSAFERLQESFFGSSVVVYCKIGRWAQNMNCWNLQKFVTRTCEDIKDKSKSTCDIATVILVHPDQFFWGLSLSVTCKPLHCTEGWTSAGQREGESDSNLHLTDESWQSRFETPKRWCANGERRLHILSGWLDDLFIKRFDL